MRCSRRRYNDFSFGVYLDSNRELSELLRYPRSLLLCNSNAFLGFVEDLRYLVQFTDG